MKPRVIGRVISAIIFGALLTCLVRLDHVKGRILGREAFLAKQEARFDRHFARLHPIALELAVGLFMSGTVFGAYELSAFGITKLLSKAGGEK